MSAKQWSVAKTGGAVAGMSSTDELGKLIVLSGIRAPSSSTTPDGRPAARRGRTLAVNTEGSPMDTCSKAAAAPEALPLASNKPARAQSTGLIAGNSFSGQLAEPVF